ncbi:citrate reductase cytochrome c-type subunit [Citrobacter freundii]|nr:citrate reductase cytochrome c-type subunit [Citrobacter freundii]
MKSHDLIKALSQWTAALALVVSGPFGLQTEWI